MKTMKKNYLEFYDLSAENQWEKDAKIYVLYYLNQPRFESFDPFINNWQGLRVLDIGCGGGFTCEYIAQRRAIVSGIDQSSKCIEQANLHGIANKLKIDYRHGYAENLPYPDNSFDVVICVDVLEHVADVDKTLMEIYRVLDRGGFFFFDTINRNLKSKIVMIWLLEDILRQIPRGIHDWKKFIKPEELTQQMAIAGFKHILIKGFDLFGEGLWSNIQAYLYYKKTGGFQGCITDNTSLMYIGKAEKCL